MKNKRKLIIGMLLILGLVMVIIFFFEESKNEDSSKKPEYTENNCLSKGNVCNDEQIKEGLLLSVDVNKKNSYDFYVIDNDENSLTLIMNKNIADNIDWHNELINMKGPLEALMQLYESTEKWSYIKPIEDYIYEDFGKKSSDILCANGTSENYSCEYNAFKSRGYDKIVFSKNEKYVDFNLVPDEEGEEVLERYDLMDYDLRARLITVEEIEKLGNVSWLSSNLNDDEGYWTMSSSTAVNTNYALGAYAVVNNENTPTIESVFVRNSLNKQYKMGIRPVITIEKKVV